MRNFARKWQSLLIGCSASLQNRGISFAKFSIQFSIWQFLSHTKYVENAQYISHKNLLLIGDAQHKLCYNNYNGVLKANDAIY